MAAESTTAYRKSAGGLSFLLLFLGLVVFSSMANAAYLLNYPLKLVQPDGEILSCFVTGDEFWRRVHDARGFSILQNPVTGFYVYAMQAGEQVVASDYRVGWYDPETLGIMKGLAAPPPSLADRQLLRPKGPPASLQDIVRAPLTGTINNIVIFIRFSGETEFGDATSLYDDMFNAGTAGSNSMYNYFQEASYVSLSISTTFYPLPPGANVLSYEDLYPRGYYQPYNAVTNPIGYQDPDEERINREHTLLKNAVDATSSQVPPGLNVDGDGDGYVDNVCFIVRGDADGWSDLLWPHMWSLFAMTATINDKRVWSYNFQLQDSLKSSGVGVLCHEMFHSLGSPDLYRYYNNTIEPVGYWDVMAHIFNPPQHMGAYMKYKYGQWISSIPTITTSGTYSVNPLTSSANNCYRIDSPYSSTEYFVVEYRKKAGTFENSVPGEGLLVYRINTTRSGNAYGPPDEVYIYRPGGTLTQNGYIYIAFYSQATGRKAISDWTNPSSFLSTGGISGLNISKVGTAGDTISFTVSFKPSLFIVSPTYSSDFYTGSTASIMWMTCRPQNANVKIQLYKGTTWVNDINLKTPNDGSYDWTLPKSLTPGTNYRIRIRTVDNLVADYSDNFDIYKPSISVYQPSSHTGWIRNTTEDIRWYVNGTMNPSVKIQLFRGTTFVQTIAARTPNSGSYSWTIPALLAVGSNYRIKIITVDNLVTGRSRWFKIYKVLP